MAGELERTKKHSQSSISFVAPESTMPELTLRAIVVGTLLGVVFGASSLYLVLKVGLTVSASIPVAVISLTLFGSGPTWRVDVMQRFSRTTLSKPRLCRRIDRLRPGRHNAGHYDPGIRSGGHPGDVGRAPGALLGILMMIPLRRALIVAQHGQLKYPEGTACAEVLKAGAAVDSLPEPICLAPKLSR